MNRVDGMEALDAVENGMIKLGQSRDIWQNDVVYAALAGVRLLLLDALKERRPRYALCGHIHTGDHTPITLRHPDGSETVVRNVSRLDEDYRIRYEPFVFEL